MRNGIFILAVIAAVTLGGQGAEASARKCSTWYGTHGTCMVLRGQKLHVDSVEVAHADWGKTLCGRWIGIRGTLSSGVPYSQSRELGGCSDDKFGGALQVNADFQDGSALCAYAIHDGQQDAGEACATISN